MLARIVNALTTVVLIVLIVLVAAFTLPRVFGYTPYAVLSGSMEPELPVGSLIYVHDVDPYDIEVGQAVTFRLSSGTVATHQCYDIDATEQVIYTQGIANINTDGSIMHDASPVEFSQIIGAPVACIPLLGYLNAWVTAPPGLYVVIGVVAALLIVRVLIAGFAPDPPNSGRHAPAHMRKS